MAEEKADYLDSLSTTTSSHMNGKSAKPATEKQDDFRFLDLPPELRNRIYEYVFEGNTTTIRQRVPYDWHFWYFEHQLAGNPIRYGLPALLMINRQTRAESLGLFYARTKWILRDDTFALPLVRKLGRERIALATCICYVIVCDTRRSDVIPEAAETVASYGVEDLEYELGCLRSKVERKIFKVELQRNDGSILWAKGLDELV